MDLESKIEQYLKMRRRMKPSIEIRTCALLVIDMQEYQVREDGSIARLLENAVPGMLQYFIERVKKTVVPNIAQLLDFFRSHDLPVYFAKLASMRSDGKDYSKNYRDFNKLAESLIGEPIFPDMQSPSASIIPELAPKNNEVVFIKTTSGSFASTDLDHQLRNLGVQTVVVVGVVTNFCVETTARAASDLGFQVFVIDDACAAWTPSLHEASLKVLELRYAKVLKTDEILKQLKKKLSK